MICVVSRFVVTLEGNFYFTANGHAIRLGG